MIKNMIFDMGNVLLRFEPELFMERAGVAPEDRPLVLREVFRSLEWVRMDRGALLLSCARADRWLLFLRRSYRRVKDRGKRDSLYYKGRKCLSVLRGEAVPGSGHTYTFPCGSD